MKKSVKIVIIASIILAIVAIVAVCILFMSSKDKISLKADEFKSTMEEKGYSLIDATEQFLGIDEVQKVYLAVNSDYKYQMEFYEISDVPTATNFYNNYKSVIEAAKGDISVETNVEMKNYAKYTLTSNEQYMVISRIDNTAIYIVVEEEYKEEVENVLKEIGY